MLNFIVISERELLVDSHLVLEKTLLGIRTALHLVLFDTLLLVWILTQIRMIILLIYRNLVSIGNSNPQ